MSVGDVKSNARGSGARYNDGKPDLSLIPAWIVADVALALRDTFPQMNYDHRAWQVLYGLGEWQQGRRELINVIDRLALPLQYAAQVFSYGARKYAAWNWIKGMPWSVPLACAQRHALAMMAGEELDQESGLPHEGHLACNIIMLMQFEESYPEGNDITWDVVLPKREEPPTIREELGESIYATGWDANGSPA